MIGSEREREKREKDRRKSRWRRGEGNGRKKRGAEMEVERKERGSKREKEWGDERRQAMVHAYNMSLLHSCVKGLDLIIKR